MVKRSRIVKVTREAKALKKLRILRGLSTRQLCDLLSVSQTTISHIENGRAKITDKYIQRFLSLLDYSAQDWNFAIEQNEKKTEIGERCVSLVRKLDEDKLKLVYAILQNF